MGPGTRDHYAAQDGLFKRSSPGQKSGNRGSQGAARAVIVSGQAGPERGGFFSAAIKPVAHLPLRFVGARDQYVFGAEPPEQGIGPGITGSRAGTMIRWYNDFSWSELEHFEYKSKFSARLYLPRVTRKLKLIFESGDEVCWVGLRRFFV